VNCAIIPEYLYNNISKEKVVEKKNPASVMKTKAGFFINPNRVLKPC